MERNQNVFNSLQSCVFPTIDYKNRMSSVNCTGPSPRLLLGIFYSTKGNYLWLLGTKRNFWITNVCIDDWKSRMSWICSEYLQRFTFDHKNLFLGVSSLFLSEITYWGWTPPYSSIISYCSIGALPVVIFPRGISSVLEIGNEQCNNLQCIHPGKT